MPTRPPVHQPHGRAPKDNARAYDQARGSASARGYGRDWQRLRDAFLRAHPLCLFCEREGRLTEATDVDHIQAVEERPDLRLEWSNLRSLCHPCHTGRTSRDQVWRRHPR